jgi:hypothetical protein
MSYIREPIEFIQRIQAPLIPKLPTVDVLERSIKGMTARIKAERNPEKRQRLIDIRAEFQDLIDRM